MIRSSTLTAVLFAFLAAPFSASANGEYETINQYSVEFACGTNDGGNPGVVPGEYATVVNVHNANPTATNARALVSLTVPGMQKSDRLRVEFDPQQSRQLDCGNIRDQFAFIQPIGVEPLLEGFLLIQSTDDLVVVARYTATGETGEVSVDVERIAGDKIRREIDHEEDDGKVTICHRPPGNPGNSQTIEVSTSAVDSHIANHGDYEGECDDRDDVSIDDDDDDANDANNGNRYGRQ